MRIHCENTREIAVYLEDHPAVERVYYPGLSAHPNHDVAAEQMRDFGAMVSVELAESLGGVESLVEQPATMTHQDLSNEELESVGLSESLVRLSVGTEHVDDLRSDLEAAIEAGLH